MNQLIAFSVPADTLCTNCAVKIPCRQKIRAKKLNENGSQLITFKCPKCHIPLFFAKANHAYQPFRGCRLASSLEKAEHEVANADLEILDQNSRNPSQRESSEYSVPDVNVDALLSCRSHKSLE